MRSARLHAGVSSSTNLTVDEGMVLVGDKVRRLTWRDADFLRGGGIDGKYAVVFGGVVVAVACDDDAERRGAASAEDVGE